MLEALTSGYSRRKPGSMTPIHPSPPDFSLWRPNDVWKWPPEGLMHGARDMGAELAVGPLSQEQIDDSFLYVTFYPTL